MILMEIRNDLTWMSGKNLHRRDLFKLIDKIVQYLEEQEKLK